MPISLQPQILALQFLTFVAVHKRFVQGVIAAAAVTAILFLFVLLGPMSPILSSVLGTLIIMAVIAFVASLTVSAAALDDQRIVTTGYEYLREKQTKLLEETSVREVR